MNKISKIILGVVLACLVIGGALTAIGLTSGKTSNFHVTLAGGKFSTDEAETVEGSVDLEAFDELKVSISSLSFEVIEGDSYRLEYKVPKCYVPEVKQSGKELSIKQPTIKGIHFGWNGLSTDTMEYYHLIVPKTDDTVKCNITLTSGEFDNDILNLEGIIKLTSGDVTMKDISYSGDLLLTSGDVKLENITGKSLRIEKTSGNTDVKDCSFEEIDVDSTSGNTEFEKLTADNITFELTSGELDMELTGDEKDYNYDLSCTSGEISVNGSSKEHKYKDDNGSTKNIKGSCTSGDVDIEF